MTLEGRLKALATGVGAYIKASILPRVLPNAGAAGQVLTKATAADYAAAWADPALKKLGAITISQANLVTAGVPVVLSATLAGVKAGDHIIFVPTVCPVDRLTGQARCDADGVVKVWVHGPGLTLLTSYSITGNVYKIG